MSREYDEYLDQHLKNVQKAGFWLIDHFPEQLNGKTRSKFKGLLGDHDLSKWGRDEYAAYDEYFYGHNKSAQTKKNFNYAWLHHIHNNPHHWQYWVLINDEDGEEALEMPVEYAFEMIADWWSFSWKNNDLWWIFDWYSEHKAMMKLHPKTRKLVETILDCIRADLEIEKHSKTPMTHLEHMDKKEN